MIHIAESLESELSCWERECYELTKTKARERGLCGPAGCPERAEWENAFLVKRLIHAALGERLIYNVAMKTVDKDIRLRERFPAQRAQ